MTVSASTQRGRIGAYALHAKYDSRQLTAPARAAFMSRWDKEVDPHGLLSEEERFKRAEAAKRAHFLRLAYLSAKKRRSRGRQNGSKVSTRLRWQVLERDHFRCQYCGRSGETVDLVVDHMIPVSRGGLATLENLCTACSDCNAGKADEELSDG